MSSGKFWLSCPTDKFACYTLRIGCKFLLSLVWGGFILLITSSMASNSSSMEPEMTAAYDSFSIGEDEDDGLVFQSDDRATGYEGLNDVRFCLVGWFLTDKVINFPAMKNTMAVLWRPGNGVCIKDLSSTIFFVSIFS